MKVLFAVSNEEISESIIKKYQKMYKQIISYKNVYYFNAIIKELQKDKTYDRIVISEDLEAFTHTQYDQIDKFIFEKLDNISDEASNQKGDDIPIILICSDRRTKSEQILVKLFGIGIYNAIIGTDRSVDEVCRLINRPRSKKEAKAYYKIDSEEVNYQAENENDVSEMEIQNILAHYKRLGKNEDKYVESFNNIAAQYNDTQLRIISKFLPLNVRAVLEEKSPKYQKVMSFNSTISDKIRKKDNINDHEGPSEILLKPHDKERVMSGPVVIPSAVNMEGVKKTTRAVTNKVPKSAPAEEPSEYQVAREEIAPSVSHQDTSQDEIIIGQANSAPVQAQPQKEIQEQVQIQEQPKRRRGRPRKNAEPDNVETATPVVKRKRGRPKKNAAPEEETGIVLPGLESETEEEEETGFLPGFEDDNTKGEEEKTVQQTVQPQQPQPQVQHQTLQQQPQYDSQQTYNVYNMPEENDEVDNSYLNNADLSSLLTQGKKIACFLGTTKNGTSFIVNNLAEQLSSMGVNTAILDTTTNRNSYYIYTKNEENLRETATNSIEGLSQGVANGIKVHKNLTVYTSLPNENEAVKEVDQVLATLIKNYSLVLIDTDFNTPKGYFKQAQEMYLVQTMDILTIQPLTAFLRELKSKNILDEQKLRIVLNKYVNIKGIKPETIIGGMAFYNDPAMSFMTELFDKDLVKYIEVPFEEETYIRYLEGVIQCEISLRGYSKAFLQALKNLGNMVYTPMTYAPPSANNVAAGFSPGMNNTLSKMKRRF